MEDILANQGNLLRKHQNIIITTRANKVITTMVIRPLDDRTVSARFVFTNLGLW